MDDGDVVIGIGPVGMGRADIDVGFRRHARVADAVRALELAQVILLGDRAASPRSLISSSALPIERISVPSTSLDIVGELLHVAVIVDAIAKGVFGGLVASMICDAELVKPLLDLGAARA